MPWTNKHLEWLEDTGEKIRTACGHLVPVYKFNHDIFDTEIMSSWATHFRNHYCSDNELDLLKPPNFCNNDYLIQMKFPDAKKPPGPSIRAGDFAEILVADYLQYLHEFYVPRTRYDRKIIGNESSKGSDVIAFRQENQDYSRKDELLIYEVKALLSENKPDNRLQTAIDDSKKDELRIAESLNAIKQRLFDKNDHAGMQVISRFQNLVDNPYKMSYGAAAVVSESSYEAEVLAKADTSSHPFNNELSLLVIYGKELMTLVHALYERAANEA
jgi:hypothetical protein